MRLVTSLALATSAAVAFNRPLQDTLEMSGHQRVPLDSAVYNVRALKAQYGDTHEANDGQAARPRSGYLAKIKQGGVHGAVKAVDKNLLKGKPFGTGARRGYVKGALKAAVCCGGASEESGKTPRGNGSPSRRKPRL
ncbi:hypothetical protein AeNC1_018303 [Aphanomyces euteiches]|nr:hypothetical protein AeNC1_018303 [Aphanomyces euteiches]